MTSTLQGTDIAGIVGRNIRLARLQLGLKQRELAVRISPSTTTQRISDWERGVPRPSDTSLILLSRALGREFAWFFTDHSDERIAA